ncbi:hypothetical protein TNCV_3081461 [Trichonephila clavipes]|nr:hypothetical protein TNCV_3081461 [Trichonephila clavipes]
MKKPFGYRGLRTGIFMTPVAVLACKIAVNWPPLRGSIGCLGATGVSRFALVSRKNLGHQSLPPTDLGRVDEERASPRGGYHNVNPEFYMCTIAARNDSETYMTF